MAVQKEGIGKELALRCIWNSNKLGNVCASAPLSTAWLVTELLLGTYEQHLQDLSSHKLF